jgi:RecB family exonuclease
VIKRRTIIVADATAAAMKRLQGAREGWHGVDIRTMDQVASRLAGGFLQPIDADALAEAAAQAIAETPEAELGDLHAVADLPGLPGALAVTLFKVWHANIDLAERAAAEPSIARLQTLARLEAAVLGHLPPAMLRPAELVGRALSRIDKAEAVLGDVELAPLLDLAPCWRPLMPMLRGSGKLHWHAGPYAVPAWWDSAGGTLHCPEVATIEPRTVTCATSRHEVIEAIRWARSLLATGVQAQHIAFAAAAPGEYDDLILAIAEEASLPVHFAHGRRALTTSDGQTAAALADLLLYGLSQERVRRLARLAHGEGTPFHHLPADWDRHLPRSAPLDTPERWQQAMTAVQAATAVNAIILPAIDLLARGSDIASEAGEVFLRGSARLLWRRALTRAPATALEASLGGLRLADGVDPAASVGWMHASALATSPRSYVWLLGLNALTWPRASREDPLLPDHIISTTELDPLPVTHMDRLAFRAIGGTTTRELVCSASRRDATGRQLGLSPLLPPGVDPERLRRTRVPAHAMSEQDRMMARPGEFAGTPRASSAAGCWLDWHTPDITAHDGLVQPDHPVLAAALGRIHSASSLRKVLRNPLGFTWQYALGWKEPETAGESMDLEPADFGNLVHEVLQAALPAVGDAGGIGRVSRSAITAAVADAQAVVAAQWQTERPVPPALLWDIRLRDAEAMAVAALTWPLATYPGQVSYSEVVFGDPDVSPTNVPWDGSHPVTIPDTDLRILGRIDRLDLAGDGSRARVVDYKTGKPRDPGTLEGGKELQRCLYAYAVQAKLGPHATVEAALLFLRSDAARYVPLDDIGAALETLTTALLLARRSLLAGRALPGPDTGDAYDAFALALPAGPAALTEQKKAAAKQLLGDAALIWDHE